MRIRQPDSSDAAYRVQAQPPTISNKIIHECDSGVIVIDLTLNPIKIRKAIKNCPSESALLTFSAFVIFGNPSLVRGDYRFAFNKATTSSMLQT
jgi:hypothetical protein